MEVVMLGSGATQKYNCRQQRRPEKTPAYKTCPTLITSNFISLH